MSVYKTEEEQIAAIKKWWQSYSTPLMFLLSLILLIYSGMRYWDYHQEKIKTQASYAFEQLMQAVSNHDNKSIKAFSNRIIQDFPNSVYSDASYLTLAKVYVTKNDLSKAKDLLSTVSEKGSTQVFRQVARIRYARILTSESHYAEALDLLSTPIDKAFTPIINELKGDIYAAQKDYPKAAVAYQTAIKEVKKRGMGNIYYLEMKSNELTSLVRANEKVG